LDQPIGDIVETGAAVALQVGAKEAQFSHRRDQLGRERARREVLPNHGHELFVDEVPHGVAHHALLFREELLQLIEIDALESCHVSPLACGAAG
jgi:hypothetical protein